MLIPARVERRLLVNLRADPEVAAARLPASERALLVDGSAVVGLCCVRMRLPGGWRTDAVAHRIATERGVHIWRRDTSSRMTVLAGGRLFPGVHGPARMDVDEGDDGIHLRLVAGDGLAVDVAVVPAGHLGGTLFEDIGDAAAFFERGAVGTSPGRDGTTLEAVRLAAATFALDPVRIEHARSTFYDAWPAGSVTLDHAALMRPTPVRWHAVRAGERGGVTPTRSCPAAST